jgi:foldase protein PrsA
MKIKKSGGITLKNIRKLICSALITAFAMSAAGCSMIEKTPEAINKTVLAKVGKVDITREQLDAKMEENVISQLKTTYGDDYRKSTEAMAKYKESAPQYLDQLVVEEMLLQKAKEFKLVPDLTKMDEEVQKELDSIKNNYFEGDQKKFDSGIIQYGYTIDSLKDQVKEQLTTQTNQIAESRAYEYVLKDITVTDDEIKSYYDTNKASLTKAGSANLAHILVATEEEAKTIKAKIDAGASFADMAKQYGTDGTKDSGGDLGNYSYDTTQLDQDFMAGAKTLKEGEVSQPVKTQFGYHLIKATNVVAASDLSFDEIKGEIKSQLIQQKKSTEFQTKLEELKKELKVKTYESKL